MATPQISWRAPVLADVLRSSVMSPVQRLVSVTSPAKHQVFSLRYFDQNCVFTGDPDLTAELVDDEVFERAHAPSLYALREDLDDSLFTAYDDELN